MDQNLKQEENTKEDKSDKIFKLVFMVGSALTCIALAVLMLK